MWKLPLFDAIKAQISADRVIPQPTKSVSAPAQHVAGPDLRLRNSKKSDLTPRKAARVAAPMVAECFANLECKVVDTASSTNTICSFSRW
jgi:flavin reductase (DIM6/NTAB) family NADH-FMN oxidoreductase RutF